MLIGAALVLICSGCTEKDGPAARMGEQIDDTISDVQDRVERAGDAAIERIDAAEDEAREAVDEIGDALRDD